MKVRLFGKDLFEYRGKNADDFLVPSVVSVEKATHIPDFKQMGHGGEWSGSSVDISNWVTTSDGGVVTLTDSSIQKKAETKKEKAQFTPKRVYEMQMLHDKAFVLNMDPKYVDSQIKDFKEKLALMKDPKYDYHGSNEIGSIILRMENRKKYETSRKTFEKFPYTTNKRINNVLKAHSNLQLGEISQFIADMPNEATEAMKEYNAACEKLCSKKAIFYIIADKKDFRKTESRRDPILLAQSPFGHFWQILGAWDEEMLFLEEL